MLASLSIIIRIIFIVMRRPSPELGVHMAVHSHHVAAPRSRARAAGLSRSGAVADPRHGRQSWPPGWNVSQGMNLPRTRKPEHLYLTHDHVEDLANECGYPSDPSKQDSRDIRASETYRLVVLFLACIGVRSGEMAAPRAGRLDVRRRRAVIAESVTPVQGQGLVWGRPRATSAGRCRSRVSSVRSSPFTSRARGLTNLSSAASVMGSRCALPLSEGPSTPQQPRSVCRTWIPPASAHGIEPREASGAEVKVVKHMLGRASATTTLDTHGHLFEGRLNEVGDAMDAAREAARERRAQTPAAGRVRMVSNRARWRERRSGPDQRFRWSGPLFRLVPPTGFEPALPP